MGEGTPSQRLRADSLSHGERAGVRGDTTVMLAPIGGQPEVRAQRPSLRESPLILSFSPWEKGRLYSARRLPPLKYLKPILFAPRMDDETEHRICLCALELEKKRYNPVHVSRPFGYAGRLLLVVFLSASQAHLAQADDGDLARVQAQLYSGKLSEARKSAEAWVQAQPANQTAKFASASTGFFQAVEKLGQDFHKYGLRSVWTDPSGGMSGVPFLRLPVPQNLNPERASYEAIRTVLSEFNSRLQAVDAELSGIELNDSIDYPLDLKQVRLDFKGGGSQEGLEPLWLVFQRITAMRPPEGESPNLIVNFDAADVVWLRGYTHLLSAITDFLLAHDWHKGFDTALHNIFPRSTPEFLR